MLKNFILISIVILNFTYPSYSQNKKPDFQKRIDSILVVRPNTYQDINWFLRYFKRDTTNLKRIITVFEKHNYKVGLAYAENQLGIRYRNFSLYQKAITTHQKALKIAESINNIEFRVFSLNMLGVDYRKLDANRTALDYNQEALALAETVKSPSLGLRRSIAVSHNSMGNIYLLLKQYDLAIEQLKQSQLIEKEINNKLGLAINNQNIGYAHEAQGRTKEALEHYQKSLALNTEINSTLGKVICNSSIATIYIKQDKIKEALKLIKHNIPIVEKMGNKDYLSSEYLNLGWAQTKLKRFNTAENNLLKGLKMAKEYNLISNISTAYSHLSEFNQLKGDYGKALEYYKKAEEFDSKVSNERTIQYVNDLIIKYDSERKNSQIKDLAKQNEIANLQLTKNRNLWIISLSLLMLLGGILYTFYRYLLVKSEKKIIHLEQEALRSQMNPHFIFNSLNAIKLYIINNEQKNAVYYLNKFSKLIRKILSATREKEITLAEEIETSKLYIEIENIRFSNEIKSTISIDDALDTKKIHIPSLILQPFIENAIWHGLSSKKGEKRIAISFDKESNSYFKITLLDNGIGREMSNELNKNKIHKKQSIGIKLTEERLTNFCKNFKHEYALDFEDLYDSDKNALGTRVILRIPLK